MQAPSGQTTGPALRTALGDGTLAGQWVLDPHRSSVRLKTRSLGLIPVSGVFRDVSGHGTVSAEGEVSGTLKILAASVDSGVGKRDVHLRSAEIFDSAGNPHIIFAVDGIRFSGPGNGVTVTGSLTVRDRTRPLSFDAAATVRADGDVELDAQARIDRTDFGVGWRGDALASKINILIIHATFTRP
ncbi:MAG TPA: YceI family protein [Actinocrinis sp.]|jgi:polyisoprenoid-binding protein YceI